MDNSPEPPTKQCEKCSANIPLQAQRCSECGAKCKSLPKIKACHECLAQIPEKEKKCPKCGGQSEKPNNRKSVIIALVIMFAVISVLSVLGGDPYQSANPQERESIAFVMAQQYVTDRLKSPSSADFSPTEYTASPLGEDRYKIESYVDSQNGFGAVIRTEWSIVLRYKGDDTWTMEELSFDGERLYP